MSENVHKSQRLSTVAVILNRDLLFGSHIRSAVLAVPLEARFVKTTERFIEALIEVGDAAAIGIIDMNGAVAWDVLGTALKALEGAPPTLAFGPHVDIEARRAAKAAGVTRIVSNGQFQSDMLGLIGRYRRI